MSLTSNVEPTISAPHLRYMHVRIEDENGTTTETLSPQTVIKVGGLRSSSLHLDGASVARMHAVIEQGKEGPRVIDLGSKEGVLLNGKKVDKTATLPTHGKLQFGDVRVDYMFSEKERAHWTDFKPDTTQPADEPKETNPLDSVFRSLFVPKSDDHHKKMCKSLLDLLMVEDAKGILPSKELGEIRKVLGIWETLDASKKRDILRAVVSTIRDLRTLRQVWDVASQEFSDEYPVEYWEDLMIGVTPAEADKFLGVASEEYHVGLQVFQKTRDTLEAYQKETRTLPITTESRERLRDEVLRIPVVSMKRLMHASFRVTLYLCAGSKMPVSEMKTVIQHCFKRQSQIFTAINSTQ